MGDSSSPQTPFLGGGPKFNQAGNNTPLHGETKAEVPPPPAFGGPKVWAGTLVILVLVLGLYLIYGQGLFGVHHIGGRGGISTQDVPTANPDAPQ